MDPIVRAQAVALYTQMLDAWNRRSAADFASVFSPDANVVGFDGSQMDGQEAIRSTLRDIFASHPTAAYVAKVREIRLPAPGVTLLRAVVGMVPPAQTELNPSVNAIQSVVFVGSP